MRILHFIEHLSHWIAAQKWQLFRNNSELFFVLVYLHIAIHSEKPILDKRIKIMIIIAAIITVIDNNDKCYDHNDSDNNNSSPSYH